MQWMVSSLKGSQTISKQYDFSHSDTESVISGLLPQTTGEPFFFKKKSIDMKDLPPEVLIQMGPEMSIF